MAEGGRLLEDGTPEVEVLDDRARPEVERAPHELLEPRLRDLPGALGPHHDGYRLRHADRVGHLHLGPLGQPGRDHVLGDVARHVGARPVHLRRVLAGEGATAVWARAAVGVHDDLAAGEPGVAHRPACHEPAGRVDVVDDLVGIDERRRHHGLDHVLDDVVADLVLADVVGVLARHDDGLDAHGPAILVAHAHLALAVGAEVRQRAVAPDVAEPLDEPVAEHDRQRHQRLRLAAGVPEHEPLVAGAFLVHAHGDVGRLLVDRGDDAAGVAVEPVGGADVADVADRPAHQLRHVHVAGRGDLARHDHEARRQQRLARHAAPGVLRENRVEHRVGNLVGDLVGVPLSHRLRREQVLIPRHATLLRAV
jgi:hypothetical protein